MAALMQILGARYDPMRLIVADDHGRHELPLVGDLAWDVGPRHCTGYWRDGWQRCPDMAAVPDGQCLACFRGRGDPARRDDQPACIFEPLCQGDTARCVCSFGGVKEPVPHVVYLAFYGPLPKVGMTMAQRVETRLAEQGADAYCIITTTEGRAAARATEQQVAFLTGIPEWRRHSEVLPQWTRPVDRSRIETAAKTWRERLGPRYDVGPLVHVRHGMEPLPAPAQRVPAGGWHEGTWIGGRGAYVFYAPASTPLGTSGAVRAIKRGDLTGRVVQATAP